MENRLLSGCGFVQNIVPQSLSSDRRIKIEQNKNIKKTSKNLIVCLKKLKKVLLLLPNVF